MAEDSCVGGEKRRGHSTGQHGTSSLPPYATTATPETGKKHAAPFRSSTLGRDGGGGGGVPSPVSSRDDAVIRERFDCSEHRPTAATTNPAVAGAAAAASRDSAASGSTGSEEDTGSEVEVEVEVEAVGWGLSLSLPNDPEITHPQRVTE